MDLKEEYSEKVRELLEPVVEAQGMDLIYAECLPMRGRWIVRLYLDRPGGITVEDCAFISGLAGDVLDVHNLPPCSYTLEVSSPGPQRPIHRDADFLRFQGRRIKVKTKEKIEGRKAFSGVLLSYREEGGVKTLRVGTGGNVFAIPRSLVASAHLDDSTDF
ncbi:MAG: ribosome maturation factor RimP [Syntrophales bacterium]|nr:ribosome maturation factor RimP [Syntrophales bacterium]